MEQGSLQFLAPLYGAGAVIFYSYTNFNDSTYETRMGLERLNSLLSVSRMRTASIVRLSYLYYVSGLLTIYLLVSAYVLVFTTRLEVDEETSNAIGGAAPGALGDAMGDSGTVFLGVALAVVGFARNMPFLKNIEMWLRRSAHGLAGIPTSVLAHTRELMDRQFDVNLDLLPLDEQTLLNDIRRHAPADGAFLRDVGLIAAVGAWIMNSRSLVSETRLHESFGQLEDSLRKRRRELFGRIRESFSRHGDAASSDQDGVLLNRASLASEADELADDMCVLLALYEEHGLLRLPTAPSSDPVKFSKNQLRHEQLKDFIIRDSEIAHGEQRDAHRAMLAISWSFGIIMIAALVWSAVPGLWEQQVLYWGEENATRGWYARLRDRVQDGLLTLFLPVAVGIGIWQGSRSSFTWGCGLCDSWTVALRRALLIFGASWVVGAFFSCGAALWSSGMENGWNTSSDESLKRLAGIFDFNAPFVIRGAVLALLVVGCLDRWNKDRPTSNDIVKTSLLAAVFMGLTGGAIRLHGVMSSNLSEAAWPSEYRAGVVVYAVAYAALIGFAVIFTLTSALTEKAPEKPSPDAGPEKTVRRRRFITSPLARLHRHLQGLSRARRRPDKGRSERGAARRGTLAAITVLCILPTIGLAQHMTIGVRQDARPYVWIDTDAAGQDQRKGYFWEVCALMAANAGLTFEAVPVDLDKRHRILTGQDKDIDLLCDPTTVTVRRLAEFQGAMPMGKRPHLRVSPIFHLANRGVLRRTPHPVDGKASWWDRCRPRIGLALGSTASAQDGDARDTATRTDTTGSQTATCIRLSEEPKIARGPIRIAVGQTTSADALNGGRPDPLPRCGSVIDDTSTDCVAPNHQDAARLLCTASRDVEYHGDIELIEAAVAHWRQMHPGPDKCHATRSVAGPDRSPDARESTADASKTAGSPRQDTYEPYVLVMSNRNINDLDLRLTTELYRLAQDGRLRNLLTSHFPDTPVSRDLDSLLRILSIPAGNARPATLVPPGGGTPAITTSVVVYD